VTMTPQLVVFSAMSYWRDTPPPPLIPP
jgi:hypothetical protein